MKVILSYGMGVESTAILARWIFESEIRPLRSCRSGRRYRPDWR